MKKLLVLTFITFLTLSCSTKWRTIDKVVRNEERILSIADNFFEHYKENIHLDNKILDRTHLINDKEHIYLRKNLKVHNVYLMYEVDDPASVDSLVIFTRSTLTKQHLIMVDMRRGPRHVMPKSFKRISERIYYCERQGGLTKMGYQYN